MTASMSRRHFLTGAGTLAVSFTIGPDLLRASVAGASPRTGSLRVNPTSPASVTEAWLVLSPSSTTIYSGKVELGTGVHTALTQIVCEELRLGMADVHFVQGDTRLTPSQGGTVGSKTVQIGAITLRQAAATAYRALLDKASAHLGVDPSQLIASDARFRVVGSDDRSVSYRELIAREDLVLAADPGAPVMSPSSYSLVGTSAARLDIPEKVTAKFRFVHDVQVPGMLHGRVIRPPGRNATFGSISNLARAQSIPGFVQVVQIDRFVGVVATSEWAAAAAASPQTGITVSWQTGPPMLPFETLPDELRDPANHYRAVVERDTGNVDAAFESSSTVVEAEYFTPFQMHGSMGASAAVADVRALPHPDTGVLATIWSGTQNVTNLRGSIARLLGIAQVSAVHVIYEEASGCYGHNGADDCAADAALLSQAVGAPVRVQWTRQDEHGWEPLGGAQAHDMRGAVDDAGVTGWFHRIYAATANSRPSANNAGTLLAGALTGLLPANLPTSAGNASGRNAPVTYGFAHQRVESRLVKSFETQGPTSQVPASPLRYRLPRTTALRSLGGFSNSFANESFLDELASAGGFDPLQLRVDSLVDPRAIAVVEALRPSWESRPTGGDGTGAGVAYQQYENQNAHVASYVEVVVDTATGVVQVRRVVVAHDCGLIINPDGLRNQIEGNVIQGVSRTLKEEVVYHGDRVTTTVWDPAPPFSAPPQYSVLRFNEVPPIESILIDRPDLPPLGAGEPAIGTIGGAIGNAVFAATGVRIRTLPMLPGRVLAALHGP